MSKCEVPDAPSSLASGASIAVTVILLEIVTISIAILSIKQFMTNQNASDLNTSLKRWSIFTIALFLFASIFGAIVVVTGNICPNWYHEPEQFETGYLIYALSSGFEWIFYIVGLIFLNFVFFKRIVLCFENSVLNISTRIIKIVTLSIYLQTILFILYGIFAALSLDIVSTICIAVQFLLYFICFFYLIWLFISRLNTLAGMMSLKTNINIEIGNSSKSSSDIDRDGGNNINVVVVPKKDLKKDLKNGAVFAVVRAITLLSCLALISSFLDIVSTILIDAMFDATTSRNIFSIVAIFYQMDYFINIVCLSLQFEYNKKYYKKFCYCCDTTILTLCQCIQK